MGDFELAAFTKPNFTPPTPIIANAELLAHAREAGAQLRDLQAEQLDLIRTLALNLGPLFHESQAFKAWPMPVFRWGLVPMHVPVYLVGQLSNAVALFTAADGALFVRKDRKKDGYVYYDWYPWEFCDSATATLRGLVEYSERLPREIAARLATRRGVRQEIEALHARL